MKLRNLILAGMLALGLAACSSPTIPDPEPTADSTAGSSGGSDADSMGFGDDDLGPGEEVPFDDMNGELTMIIYFDFDQSELRPEYADLLARHAGRLADNSRTSVRLEGHADERGSREYNIGLGERRSQAVRRLLLIQGAATSQLSTVSFGEERPAAFGSDEFSYEQNRRVEIKYTN
jgi:peptidoglycan-associated lipoprotein